jgi:uncharacterized protein with PIN domain
MVVETSAVLAILLDEPEAAEFAQLIEDDPAPCISAASVLEAGPRSWDRPLGLNALPEKSAPQRRYRLK